MAPITSYLNAASCEVALEPRLIGSVVDARMLEVFFVILLASVLVDSGARRRMHHACKGRRILCLRRSRENDLAGGERVVVAGHDAVPRTASDVDPLVQPVAVHRLDGRLLVRAISGSV